MSTYNLDAIVEQRTEAVGGTDVEFQWAGETFKIPHPLFVDDDFKEGLADVVTDVDMAVYYLGADEYERFRDLGGKSSFIALLLAKVQEDTQAALADGRPTRRSASSANGPSRQKRR